LIKWFMVSSHRLAGRYLLPNRVKGKQARGKGCKARALFSDSFPSNLLSMASYREYDQPYNRTSLRGSAIIRICQQSIQFYTSSVLLLQSLLDEPPAKITEEQLPAKGSSTAS